MAARGKLKTGVVAADFRGVIRNRPLTTLLLALVALLATAMPPAAAQEHQLPDEVVIAGGGWGHGIGMSQYGAYGQALAGKSAEEIVGHYYSGSGIAQIADQVGPRSWMITDPEPLWVNLLSSKTIFTFQAVGGQLTVCHPGGGGCAKSVDPGESWQFKALGNGTCRFFVDGAAATSPAPCQAAVKGMTPGGAHIEVGGLDTGRDEFARGVVRVRTPNGGDSFHVSVELNLEQYLYGLAEMPFSWHPEALQAQALAGRSYAAWRLYSRGPESGFSASRQAACWCHMYATTADQSYSGWTNEAASLAANWKAAVDATAGTVITHPEASQANIVAAFYSSSTGGRTENNEDMWGGNPVGYLRSKADPWSQAPEVKNPFGTWEFPFTEQALAAAYGVDAVNGLEIVDRFASGTPRRIDIHVRVGATNKVITTTGPAMYSLLALRGRNIRTFDYGQIPSIGGDFTGDGRADVAMLVPFSRTWWVGTSTPGKFADQPWLNYSSVSQLNARLGGDFNGDGRDDIAVLQRRSGRLIVGLSTGDRFTTKSWDKRRRPEQWGPLLVGDFDGDGADDIAEYGRKRDLWRVHRLVAGKPTREVWYDFAIQDPDWETSVVGDFNGDNLDDIVSLDAATGDVVGLFSDGAGFTPSAWQALPHAGGWQSVQAADFTGDGIDDLAAFDPATATWWVIAGRKATTARPAVAFYAFARVGKEFVGQVAGDVNNDGKADITAYERSSGKLQVLLSHGDGFDRALWGRIPARKRITTILALDVDGDGAGDVVAWDDQRRRWWVAESAGNSFEVSRWGKLLR